MFCERCGSSIPDGNAFCTKCGCPAPQGAQSANAYSSTLSQQPVRSQEQTTYQESLAPNANSYVADLARTVFIEQDEILLASLGNGWIKNLMLSHGLKRCNALLTNKHLYLQGQVFQGGFGNASKTTTERVLDVRYITGTYFEYENSVIHLFLTFLFAIISVLCFFVFKYDQHFIFLIPLVLSIIHLIAYYLSKKAYFRIEFGYGFTKAVSIDANIIGIPEVKEFERQIIRAKDRARADLERKIAEGRSQNA